MRSRALTAAETRYRTKASQSRLYLHIIESAYARSGGGCCRRGRRKRRVCRSRAKQWGIERTSLRTHRLRWKPGI